MKKKLLSLLLIAALMISLFPAALAEDIVIVDPEETEEAPISLVEPEAAAEPGDEPFQAPHEGGNPTAPQDARNGGKCGENVSWSLNRGKLTISGTGPMYDYEWADTPWYSQGDDITVVVIENGVTHIGECAFPFTRYLETVEMADSVTSIGWCAFDYCTNLWNLKLSDNLVEIGGWAFEHTALTQVTLPFSVQYVQPGAFAGCHELTAFRVAGGNPNFQTVDGMLLDSDGYELLCCPAGKSGTVTVPSSVTVIETSSFWDCSEISEIILPEGLRIINYQAFTGCLALNEITLPESLRGIRDSAFQSTGLWSITIPAAATDLGTNLFYNCQALRSINVAEDNPNFKSEDGVLLTKDGAELFSYPGAKAGEYRVPDGVKTIRVGAFAQCIVTELSFPDSLEEIENEAFAGCRELTTLRFEGQAPKFGAEYFRDEIFIDVVATAYYPAGDPSWTEEVRQNYGGTITWVPLSSVPGPTLQNSAMSTNGIALRWSAVNGAERYELQRKTDESDWVRIDTVNTLTYTDANVKMGGTYLYRVRAYAAGAWTAFSEAMELFFNPFSDVSGVKTIEYVAWAYNNGVVRGTSETKFSPNAPCSRIQFIMMLWKMNGSPEVSGTNPFSDISGAKTTKAILWALSEKVINSASKFNPNGNISRVQIVMILWKMAGSPKVSGTNPFTDVSGSKTTKAVLWAYQNGITKGTSATTFSPDKDCTRVQLVVFLYKFAKLAGVGTTYRALLVGEVHFSWETATRNEGDVQNLTAMLTEVKTPDDSKYEVTGKLDLSADGILDAIRTTFADADEDDVSLFFIATHGVVDISSGPYAGEIITIERPGSVDGYLTLPELADALKAVPGKVIVLLGSCGSGAAIAANDGSRALSFETSAEADAIFAEALVRAFAEAEGDVRNLGEFRESKFYVLTAAAHMESSWGYEPWGDGIGANYFPLAFAAGASGSKPADSDKDGVIILQEMYEYCYSEAFGPYWDGQGYYYQHVQVYPENSSYPLFK